MKTKVLVLLLSFLAAGQVLAVTITSPSSLTQVAADDQLYCQLTNAGTTDAASVAHPVVMKMIDASSGAVLSTDSFTSIPAKNTVWGTGSAGGTYTSAYCIFTVANKTRVRAGISRWDSADSMMQYLKAE